MMHVAALYAGNRSLDAVDQVPPELGTGDYVKIAYLTLLFLFSTPLNITAFAQLRYSRLLLRVILHHPTGC